MKYAIAHLRVRFTEWIRTLRKRCAVCGNATRTQWQYSLRDNCDVEFRECTKCNIKWQTGRLRPAELEKPL